MGSFELPNNTLLFWNDLAMGDTPAGEAFFKAAKQDARFLLYIPAGTIYKSAEPPKTNTHNELMQY